MLIESYLSPTAPAWPSKVIYVDIIMLSSFMNLLALEQRLQQPQQLVDTAYFTDESTISSGDESLRKSIGKSRLRSLTP